MILFAVTVLAVALAAGLIGNLLIRRAESAGERRVENMIGAVAEEYPGAENAFVRGMADEEFRWEEEVSDILSSYGYDSGESVPEYRRFLYVFHLIYHLREQLNLLEYTILTFKCEEIYDQKEERNPRKDLELLIIFRIDFAI